MKNYIPQTKKILCQLSRFIGAILMVAVIAPYSAQSQSILPINLGSTSHYVILAGSLVSNIPTSAVTGDIGLSPATGGNITGFGLTELTGTFYTVDAAGPVGSTIAPTLLTTAKGDLTIAYNEAAGRTPAPTGTFLDPGTGNIGGMTIVPGLYKFTSGASITGSNVTLTGSATDVWIFQIASSLNVGDGIQVILAGGANAANIFWQVGTSATLGTNSVFKGTILADQSITLNTGAVVEGRLLASNAAITLASNTVTTPATVTGVKEDVSLQEFALLQNYPNPFNPTTNIEFSVPVNGQTTLKIFNAIGQEVALLFNGTAEAGKYHSVQFNASDLASGLYFSRLEFGGKVQLKKMLLMK